VPAVDPALVETTNLATTAWTVLNMMAMTEAALITGGG
jgi:hypothetical protein